MPKTLNSQVVDEWIRVGDAESFHTARALARREGILVGGSSGTAVAAALQFARRLGPDDLVVVLCPDTGRNYLSRFFDDNWLAENRLSWDPQPTNSIGDLIRSRRPRHLTTISPEATVTEAVELLQATGISQLPVLAMDWLVGSIQEVTLRGSCTTGVTPIRSRLPMSWPAPPPARHKYPARRSLPPAAGREHRRAGRNRRGRPGHHHPHRPGAILEPEEQALDTPEPSETGSPLLRNQVPANQRKP